MNNWREEAAEAARSGRYEVALDIMEGHADLGLSDLVLKGRCIQLSGGGSDREVENGAAAFQEALAIDPNYVPALIELGWLHLSVLDDALRAREYFNRAIDVVSKEALEAFRGAADCAMELGGAEARAEVVKRAALVVNPSDLDGAVCDQDGS